MKTTRLWITRVVIIALLTAAVIKSPTAFVAALFGVILAAYLVYLWLKWKFWRLVRPLAEMGEAMKQTTLNLQKTNRPFYKPETVAADIAVLKQNGFTILGTYVAKAIPSTNIVLANNPGEAAQAIIIEQEYMDVITEVSSRYEDDKTFTCSNTRMPAIVPRPEHHPILRLPEADAQSVINEFRRLRPTAALLAVKDEEVKLMIESMYAELKAYEIETVESTVKLENQLLENFIVSSGWSAIEWHRKQNDVVIIHDKIKDYELISRFESAVGDEDEEYKKLKPKAESIIKNNTPIEAFRLLTSEIVTETKLNKLLELTDPVPAHVYLVQKPGINGN